MNRNLLKGALPKLLAWTSIAVLSTSIAFAQDANAPADQSQGQPAAQAQGSRTDGQIEMDVVHALDASPALKNDLITAATIRARVTLSGTVSSDASKQLAQSIASHVNGVTGVHNNLKVGDPGQDGQNLPPADAGAQEGPDNQQADAGNPGCTGPAPDQDPDQAAPYPQRQQRSHIPQQQQPYPQQLSLIRNSNPIRSNSHTTQQEQAIIRRHRRSDAISRIRTTRPDLVMNLPLDLL